MYNFIKFSFCCLLVLFGMATANAQQACSSSESPTSAKCVTSGSDNQKSCCTETAKETTSGCTPSSCRGAKTKFGEAKVISELRTSLVALKAKMENHKDHTFSNQAITVHGIIGETDDESLEIVSSHIAVIESELYSFIDQEKPSVEHPENKAIHVKQLQERILALSQLL